MPDPALYVLMVGRVRPGRIDKKIKLDYVATPEAIEQIEHFLGPMTDNQKASHRQPIPKPNM
jgi:hypothetical protein